MTQIREFNGTRADYETLVNLHNQLWQEKDPLEADQLIQDDEKRKSEHIFCRFFADVNGQAVGYGEFNHNSRRHHPQRFWVTVAVMDSYRKQGIGQRLFDTMLAMMKSEYHANELHTRTTESRPDSIRFLEKCGFREVKRQWENHLNLQDFDETHFNGFDRQMDILGITIKTLSELIAQDDDALYKVYELHQLLTRDVPNPVQQAKADYASWREGYSSDYADFLPDSNFIACRGNEYIGLTSFWGNTSADKLYVGLTGVKCDYRRQGIATALKLRGLQFAKAFDIPQLITFSHSKAMLELNLKLGFSIQATDILFMQRL